MTIQDTSDSPPTDSPWQMITLLYASEINAGIETDWDGGMRVWIGHPNIAEAIFDEEEFDKVAAWMDFEARRLFPDSVYAKKCS